jgi:hypothetical protein
VKTLWHYVHYLPHLLALVLAKRLSDYIILKTESIAANSTRELILWGFKRLFKTNEVSMLSKTLYSGPHGSVSVSESAGVVSLSGSLSAHAGGGAAKDVLGVSASVTLSLGVEQLCDMGLDIAAAKFPAFAAEIGLVKAALDAELSKA